MYVMIMTNNLFVKLKLDGNKTVRPLLFGHLCLFSSAAQGTCNVIGRALLKENLFLPVLLSKDGFLSKFVERKVKLKERS